MSIDPRNVADWVNPRDAADALEMRCIGARLARKEKIELSLADVAVIVKLLRRVKLKRGRPTLTLRERNYDDALVEKARQHKADLMAKRHECDRGRGRGSKVDF